MRRSIFAVLSSTGFIALLIQAPGPEALAQNPGPGQAELINAPSCRSIGPAIMGGRIVDVAVVESKPSTMYVAAASGGVWKTTNNGTTWRPVFDQQETLAIGAVSVAASNPAIVWVGTGEANPRNSVSWGKGVFKSTDGGQTWQHMGLPTTGHIGRIVIHPHDPNVVFVAALGRLWGANKERGLFQTIDGGRCWRQVRLGDSDTGCIDVAFDPRNPAVVYSAAYQVRRDAFDGGNPAVQTGPGSGLYKSVDGGATWYLMQIGLPHRPLGRCGLAVSRKDPHTLFAVVQTDRTVTVTPGQQPASAGPVDTGGIFRSDNQGESWIKVNDLCPRPFYYGQIRIDPNDTNRIYVLGVALYSSTDGGRSFSAHTGQELHSDHHALWIDPRDTDHLILGGDGGIYFSYDRGTSWEHINNLPIGQFYGVGVDSSRPYRIFGGLQDNGSWGGPSRTPCAEGILNTDWLRILGADGFGCQVDPTDSHVVYAEGQFGMLRRLNVHTGDTAEIRPQPAKGAAALRFNWNAPVLLSPHDPRVVYFGGNHLFRSADRGDSWDIISPDLTGGTPGPSPDFGHTITTIAESPLRRGLLWVGTDDGHVQVSADGGTTWKDRSQRLPGVPAERYITRLECSHFAPGTVYLSLDRHRHDDRAPYLFKSTDLGSSWVSLVGDLPADVPVHVIRQDARNEHLLFAGTEFGLYASLDGGSHWSRVSNGLPPVAVRDVAIQARESELVIATHGRSLYVLDIAPLEQLAPDTLARSVHLFDPKPARVTFTQRARDANGVKAFAGVNPPEGAVLYYYLREPLLQPPQVVISDSQGRMAARLRGPNEAGLHRLVWNLRRSVKRGSEPIRTWAAPGDYQVKLTAGQYVARTQLQVQPAD
jgi:photosystem II stability/assembly factor-like uncharacterized protein